MGRITFRVGFLLAFSTLTQEKVKKGKEKESKRNKNSKNKSLVKHEVEETKPNYILEVGLPLGYAHIEYILIPGRAKQQFDVVCWKGVAKIFFEEEEITYRVKITDDKVWIPIFIEQYVNTFEDDELIQLHQHEIDFQINVTFQHWMSKIISEGVQDFVFKEYVPNSPPPINEEEFKLETDDKFKDGKKGDKNKSKNDKNKTKNDKKTSKNDKKKEKKSKKSKETKVLSEILIKVSGEIFFTDPNLSMFDVPTPNNVITSGYVFLSVDQLMTRQQKYNLNPFVVKIDKIDDLDVEALTEAKFDSIFVQYNIPFLARGKTSERNIQRKVRFSESHAHFIQDVPSMNLVEFIQAQRFYVEICGRRNCNLKPEIKPMLFGTQQNDQKLSKKLSPMEAFFKLNKFDAENFKEMEVLAVASYDLTPLLIPTRGVSANQACHNPDNLQFQKPNLTPFKTEDTIITTNNINIKTLLKKQSNTPLSEFNLIESGTTLKMEFSFAAPICFIAHSVLAKAENINRMFLLIKNVQIAENLVDFLLNHNQQIGNELIAPNRTKIFDETILNNENFMTGFVIDNGNNFAFYIEGSIKDYIMPLWEKIRRVSPDEVKVYYNDRLIFAKRLYSYFIKMGGFCIITLQRPLKDILSMEKIYLEGYVPLPCWQALKKLDLLFRSLTLKDMNMFNLFPTVDELLSFDLEFGTAVRWNEQFPFEGLHQFKSTPFYTSKSNISNYNN